MRASSLSDFIIRSLVTCVHLETFAQNRLSRDSNLYWSPLAVGVSRCSIPPTKLSITVKLDSGWLMRLSRIQVVEAPSNAPTSRMRSFFPRSETVSASQSERIISNHSHPCWKENLLRSRSRLQEPVEEEEVESNMKKMIRAYIFLGSCLDSVQRDQETSEGFFICMYLQQNVDYESW